MARKSAAIGPELRRRIAEGELRPGEALPSGRSIARDWDVSMGAAYRVLSALARDGLVIRVPDGPGMVVTADGPSIAAAMPPEPPDDGRTPGAESREQVIRVAIDLADTDGLPTVSMRRVAQRTGLDTYGLRRHVTDKATLEILMADAIFALFPPPDRIAPDWKAGLEQLCRMQWELYRERPWTARIVSFTEPDLSPHTAAHLAWAEQTLAAQPDVSGPDAGRLAVTAADYVRGAAMNIGDEAGTEEFEFGLRCLLDGFEPAAPGPAA